MFSIPGGALFRTQLEECASHDPSPIAREVLSAIIRTVFEQGYNSKAEAVTALKDLQADITQELRAQGQEQQAEKVDEIIASLSENVMEGARIAPKRAREEEVEKPPAKKRRTEKSTAVEIPSIELIERLITHLPPDTQATLKQAAQENVPLRKYIQRVCQTIANLPLPLIVKILQYLPPGDREGILAMIPESIAEQVRGAWARTFLNEVSQDKEFMSFYKLTFGETCLTWEGLPEDPQKQEAEIKARADSLQSVLKEEFHRLYEGGLDRFFPEVRKNRFFDDVTLGKKILQASHAYNLIHLGQKLRLPINMSQLKTLEDYVAAGESVTTELQKGEISHRKKLTLDCERMYHLPTEIKYLKELTELTLLHGSFSSLPGEIGELASLQSLEIISCGISSLPNEIGTLSELTSLVVGKTRLQGLPPTLSKLTKLNHLELYDNPIEVFPSPICDLKSLQVLTLEHSNIKVIPDEIGRLSELRTLNVGYNQLKDVPVTIGNLTKLKYLGLYENQIELFPSAICDLKSLRILLLRSNKIRVMPAGIEKLLMLWFLDMSQNQVEELPSAIGKLENLGNLSLSYNKIKFLPLKMNELSRLAGLKLDHNELTAFLPDIGELKLSALDLSHNHFSTFPSNVSKMQSLQRLLLAHNEIETLPPDIQDLTTIQKLDLSENQLTTLPNELVALSSLSELNVINNPQLKIPELLMAYLTSRGLVM